MSRYIELPPLSAIQQGVVDTLAEFVMQDNVKELKKFLASEISKDENVLHEALYMAGLKNKHFFLDVLCLRAFQTMGPDFWQKGRAGQPLPHRVIGAYQSLRAGAHYCETGYEVCSEQRDIVFDTLKTYRRFGCPIGAIVDADGKNIFQAFDKKKEMLSLPKRERSDDKRDDPPVFIAPDVVVFSLAAVSALLAPFQASKTLLPASKTPLKAPAVQKIATQNRQVAPFVTKIDFSNERG